MAVITSAGFPTPSAASAVWRWGHRLLWAGLGGGLVLTLALAVLAPAFLFVVPLGVAALVAAWFLFQRPLLNLTVVLAGFAIALNPNPGVQIPELLYGIYYLAFLTHWYTRYVLLDSPSVLCTVEDRTAFFLLVASVLLTISMATIFGYPAEFVRTDLQAFMMFAFYLPVKEACKRYRLGPDLVFGVIVWLGLFVAMRNFLNFRAILIGATDLWQVAGSRPGFNEYFLMVASLGLLPLALIVQRWRLRLTYLGLFLLTFAGLLLTQSRSFWVAFALGVLVLFVLFHRTQRQRLVVFMISGLIGSIMMAFIFLGDLAVILFQGLMDRFGTLESATTQDMSLVNRFNEASAVWAQIKANPWLGYGFGAPYTYYSWVYLHTELRTFVHIGYVGLWHKLGLWGLAGMLFFWARATWQGLAIRWRRAVPPRHRALALFATASLTATTLTAITHNPFVLTDSMLLFTMLTGLAVGLSQRYSMPGESSALEVGT